VRKGRALVHCPGHTVGKLPVLCFKKGVVENVLIWTNKHNGIWWFGLSYFWNMHNPVVNTWMVYHHYASKLPIGTSRNRPSSS
jgi:hypothetical protein